MKRTAILIVLTTLLALLGCQPPAEQPPAAPEPSAADRAAETAKTNEAVFRKFIDEIFNQGKIEAYDELTTEDFVEHQEMPPGLPEGREGVKQLLASYREAFPDLEVTVEQLVASGDMVAARTVWTGTQAKEFMGARPSGQPLTFQAIDIVRFVDGKAAEHWGIDDSAQVMMGAAPAK